MTSTLERSGKVERLLLAGGTHGNEWIGARLVQRWQHDPTPVTRRSFETVTLLANPAAYERGVRYIDQDLNRSFGVPDATGERALEARRAREILTQYGPSGARPADVVLDLHTTTSSMGLTMILTNREPFNLWLAAWVKQREPRVRVYLWIDETLPDTALGGIVPRGVTLEVGPTPNNVLRGDLWLGTRRVVELCLDFCEAHNQGRVIFCEPMPLDVFTHLRSYDYPRDDSGEIQAMVHPELQDKDYQPLRPGDPAFLTFDGTTIAYQADETEVYPVFVNEAAYYEKRIAFSVTRAERLLL